MENSTILSRIQREKERPMNKYGFRRRNDDAAVWPFTPFRGHRACRGFCEVEKRQFPAWEEGKEGDERR